MNEYLKVIRTHYADFRGRARRREYWMFTLVNAVIGLILTLPLLPALVQALVAAANEEPFTPSGGTSSLLILGLVLTAVYSLAVLVPSLAVAVRRLHDTGKSGWWYLLSLIPFGNLVLLIFFMLDSEPGANRWGPNPKGVGGAVSARATDADW